MQPGFFSGITWVLKTRYCVTRIDVLVDSYLVEVYREQVMPSIRCSGLTHTHTQTSGSKCVFKVYSLGHLHYMLPSKRIA